MRIAICYPPLPSEKGVPLLSQNRQFQWFSRPTYIFPVVPATAATMLKKAGHEVAWLDGIAEEWSPETLSDRLAAFAPDVVVLETKTPVVKRHWAWIAAFKATTVPAGEDQEPMLELTRELVNRFNNTYAPVLVEPKIMLPENATARRLPGTDGKEKMSKSLGNCIYLSDDADTVWKQVKGMYTDPTHLNVSDPGHVEGNAVFTYLDAFATDQDFADFWPEFQNLDELKAAYQHGGIGDMKCKKMLNKVINRMLDPIRARRAEYEKDIPEIFNILKKGSDAAREVAAQTMDEVRKAMRIDYFEDEELIKEQTRKFSGK